MLVYKILSVKVIVKSDVFVRLCPSIPAHRVVLDVVTFVAVSSWRAIRLMVKLPLSVVIVATCVTIWPLIVGNESNSISNSFETAPPVLRAVSPAAKATAESSTLNVIM